LDRKDQRVLKIPCFLEDQLLLDLPRLQVVQLLR